MFARLGSNEDIQFNSSVFHKTSKFDLMKPEENISKTVFSRLGDKQSNSSARNTFGDINASPKFISSLKSSQPKKIIIKTNGAIRTLSKLPSGGTMQADKTPVNIRQKLPVLHPQRKTVKFSPHVDCKLIEKPTANLPVQKPIMPKINLNMRPVQVRDVKKTAITTINKNNIKFRLGNTNQINNNVHKVGVFSRLGIQNKHKPLINY